MSRSGKNLDEIYEEAYYVHPFLNMVRDYELPTAVNKENEGLIEVGFYF